MADTLVVIPTFNEIENLRFVIGRVRQVVPDADVLIVDDSSPDGTGKLAAELAEADPGIRVLIRATKQGLGRAYVAGFSQALEEGYDFIVEMDADGSHDAGQLPRMLQLARQGADLVLGSRWVTGGAVLNWPWLRSALSRGGNRYARTILRSKVLDLTSGFRVYRAQALRSVNLAQVSSQGYCFQVELAWQLERSGMTIVEHPITFIERAAGRSKMHAGIVLEALLRITAWGFRR